MDLEAERLQHCLDRIAAGEPASDVVQAVAGQPGGDEIARLVAFTASLAEVLPARADTAFRARLQAQLQSELAARPQAGRAGDRSPSLSRSRLRWQPWILRLCAAVVVVALAMGTAVKASASSLPGGALYPVKRAAEEARLALAWTATLRAQVQLDIANTRIAEISELVGRDVPVDPVVIDVLVVAYGGLTGPVGTVVDPAWAEEVSRAQAEHGQVLDALARTTDDADLRPRVKSARRALDDAAARLDAGLPQSLPSAPAGSSAGPTASPTAGSSAASSGVVPSTATATTFARQASRTPASGPISTRHAARTPAATATGIPMQGPAPTDAPPPAAAQPTAPSQPSAPPPTTVPPTAVPANNTEPTRGPTNPAADERATAIARMTAEAERRSTREAATKPPPTAPRPNRTPRADGTPDRPNPTEVPPPEPTREASPPGTP